MSSANKQGQSLLQTQYVLRLKAGSLAGMLACGRSAEKSFCIYVIPVFLNVFP